MEESKPQRKRGKPKISNPRKKDIINTTVCRSEGEKPQKDRKQGLRSFSRKAKQKTRRFYHKIKTGEPKKLTKYSIQCWLDRKIM